MKIEIDIKQLRVGNIVLLEVGNAPAAPHHINPRDILDIHEGNIADNVIISGMPISDDWAGRMKFEFVNFTEENDLPGSGYFSLSVPPIDGLIQSDDKTCYYTGVHQDTKINFVHEVQNVYLDLMKEEIEIDFTGIFE